MLFYFIFPKKNFFPCWFLLAVCLFVLSSTCKKLKMSMFLGPKGAHLVESTLCHAQGPNFVIPPPCRHMGVPCTMEAS